MGNFDHLSRLPTAHFKRQSKKYDNERKLVSTMGTEMLNHHGILCDYIMISNDPTYDPLFGDDRSRRVIRKFQLMVIFDLPAEDDRWSAFGIEGLDNFSMYVTAQHFEQRGAMGVPPEQAITMPRVGDFIKPVYNDYYYEVTAQYNGNTGLNFLQGVSVLEMLVAKYTNDHIDDPNGLLSVHNRPVNAIDIFDDTEFVNAMNGSTDVVPPTFPTTTDKGKPSPLYKPKPNETPPDDPFGGF